MSKIVDIVAPSGAFAAELLPKITAFLQQYGMVARIPEDILGQDLLSANTDSVRLALLKKALLAEDSDFIWCVRGGSGATRLLPGLKEVKSPLHKKTLMGFSDITALHLFLKQAWGWETIHGPTARQVIAGDVSAAGIGQLLQGITTQVDYPIRPMNQAAEQVQGSGTLTGGNLKLVESSLSTFWQIDTQNKILMLEDINELAYRVDRSLVHLWQAGLFYQLKALIFGDFTHSDPAEVSKVTAVLERFATEMNIPVFRGQFFGHGTHNAPWKYAAAEINQGVLRQRI